MTTVDRKRPPGFEWMPPNTDTVTYMTREELDALDAEPDDDLTEFIAAIKKARA